MNSITSVFGYLSEELSNKSNVVSGGYTQKKKVVCLRPKNRSYNFYSGTSKRSYNRNIFC